MGATAARSEELGGKIVVAPMKLEDGMVVAYLTDPHGGHVRAVQPEAGELTRVPVDRAGMRVRARLSHRFRNPPQSGAGGTERWPRAARAGV